MDSTQFDFLRKFTINNDKTWTHYTPNGPFKKWCVNENEYSSFWYNYCNMIDKNPGGDFCLCEQNKSCMPIIADMTLRFHKLSKNFETYNTDFLLAVVYCFQQSILELFKCTENQAELICCVLECDDYIEDNLIISKFRLQFPYCKTLSSMQTTIFRSHVIKMLTIENVKSRLTHEPVDNWEDIYDSLSVEQPCTMYGSSTMPNIPKLNLNYIFKKLDHEIIGYSNENVIEDYKLELEKVFIFTNHEHVLNGIVNTTIFNENQDINFWLPMFLSLSYYTVTTQTIDKSNQKSPKTISNNNSNSRKNRKTNKFQECDTEEIDDIEMAKIFLPMLSCERIREENYWLDIGKSLYNIYEGDEEGLEIWMNFTERAKSDEFDTSDLVDKCESLYDKFVSENFLTFKTLAWYAREDSPKEYQKWHLEWYAPYMEKAASGLHADVAEVLYRIYFLEFAASDDNQKSLYQFKNHIWNKLNNSVSLKRLISGDFLNRFRSLQKDIIDKANKSSDNNYKDVSDLLVKKLGSLIDNLKKVPYAKNLITMALVKFYDENFKTNIDKNPNLMGMVNCVIETCHDKAIVRPGKPEDYVSKTTGLKYNFSLSWEHPLVAELMDWLGKVFPDKELLNYFGKFSASCLRGRNSDKIFPIFTGEGNNSKSMIKKLFETWGTYVVTFPTSMFTKSTRSSGPTPELAQADSARIAFAQETGKNETFNNGPVKEMTGGDKTFTRKCHENGGSMEAFFKFILMCNKVPPIENDKAMMNRTAIFPFLATWSEDAPTDIKEQIEKLIFKLDPFFENTIPKLAPAFMWYCVQMFPAYKKEGLNVPKIVKEHTEKYWTDNDLYTQFKVDKITVAYKLVPNKPEGKDFDIDTESKITESEMYGYYKDWLAANYSGTKPPHKNEFISEMKQKKRLGETYGKVWRGVKLTVDVSMFGT